jgi:hypothetical protein
MIMSITSPNGNILVENIPQELKALPNWIVWKYESRTNKDGTVKQTKVPYDAKDLRGNSKAKSNDAGTWASFEQAISALRSPYFSGIGFCFPADRSIFGLDFDAANELTETLVARLDTYVERSPSGEGYHAIALNGQKLSITNQKWRQEDYGCNMEIYNNNARYFTFTGHVVKDRPLADCTESIQVIIAELEAAKCPPVKGGVGDIKADRSTPIMMMEEAKYRRCVTYLAKIPVADKNDGSSRLFTYARHCVRFDLSDSDAIRAIRSMPETPAYYSDGQILQRLRDAEKHGNRGEALKDRNGPMELPPAPASQKRQPITYSLSRFPKVIGDMVRSLSTENDILPPILHLAAAYAVMGTIIGKRMYCDNKGATIYPNYWAVGLAPTAANKTGTIKRITAAMEEVALSSLVPSSTASALYDVLGVTIAKKQWQAMTRKERDLAKYHAIQDARGDQTGRIILTDECTGAIRTILGSWDSKSPIKDVETFLQLTDSGSKLERQLVGDGFKGMYDLCVGFLGFSQNETWHNELGGEEFMARGLFGRFVPYTSTYLALSDVIENHTPFLTLLKDLADDAQTITDRIRCVFGDPVAIGEKDFIGRAMEELESREVVAQFIAEYPVEWAAIRNKIIGHAIKCSIIDAFANGDYRATITKHKEVVDCSPYFQVHALVLTAVYAAYFWQRPEISAFGKLEDKVLQCLRRQGPMSARELQRRIHFYNKGQFTEMMQSLIAEGLVKMGHRKAGTGPRTAVYFLP